MTPPNSAINRFFPFHQVTTNKLEGGSVLGFVTGKYLEKFILEGKFVFLITYLSRNNVENVGKDGGGQGDTSCIIPLSIPTSCTRTILPHISCHYHHHFWGKHYTLPSPQRFQSGSSPKYHLMLLPCGEKKGTTTRWQEIQRFKKKTQSWPIFHHEGSLVA